MKFNKSDFRILEICQPDSIGYIDDKRVLELMKLGYIKDNPRSNWIKNGYKTTKKGSILYNQWLNQIREKHGHVWMSNYDGDSEYYKKNSKEGKRLNNFAYSEGYHNGYKCKECGFEFCHHCYEESDIPKCSSKTRNDTMSDNNKLDKHFVAMDKSMRSMK